MTPKEVKAIQAEVDRIANSRIWRTIREIVAEAEQSKDKPAAK